MKPEALLYTCTLIAFILLSACDGKRSSHPCCTYGDLPRVGKFKDGHGAVQVDGSTAAYFYVVDGTGDQVGYEMLNHTLSLEPGVYQVKVNNSFCQVEVQAERLLKCSTGTLMVTGITSEYFYVTDSTDKQLGYELLGKAMSFFPGTYKLRVNNTETPVTIGLKELTEIKTGTLLVHGTTPEYYYVLDDNDKQLAYNVLEKPLAFLPGTYPVKLNKTTTTAGVRAGQLTELGTGTVLVKGLTEEYYYVTDTLGNALNYQTLNKGLAFFPGNVLIKMNNTVTRGAVLPGQLTEFVTGSLMLTGGGTEYYYVLDEAGKSLNYNSLNKSLSFFPAEYTVKLGGSTRKATVLAGQLTSIDAFK